MAFSSILNLFGRKDKVFYQLFDDVCATLLVMSAKLREVMMETNPDQRAALVQQMGDLERVNDKLTHDIFIELDRNFITPFDREDIHYLATSLDDVADNIFASAKKFNFYRIQKADDGMIRFCDLIDESCKVLGKAVNALRQIRNHEAIMESLVMVNSLENQADQCLDECVDRLFNEEDDAREIIKMQEIYQTLEIVTDKCEDASNVIESILVKSA